MAKASIEKITKELDKLNIDELYQVFSEIKTYVCGRLETSQKDAEETASELQSKIDRINGN